MKWFFIIGLVACSHLNNSQRSVSGCWENRKNVNQLKNTEGVVVKEANWVCIRQSPGKCLFPCNLPDSYQVGDTIIFSANQKEIFPNERWAGDPIELTAIELK